MAVTPLTTTVSVAGSATQVQTSALTASVATGGTSATATGSAAATDVALGQFDTSTGILVGARVRVAGVSTAVTSRVTGTVLANGNGRTVDTTTNLAGNVSGAGITSISNASATASRNCAGGNCTNSPSNQSSSNPGPTLAGSATVAGASLGAYAGTSTVTLGRSGTGSTTVTTGAGALTGSGFGIYGFTGGTYAIDYDYLNFSAPSFSSSSLVSTLSHDFGTVALGSGPVVFNFTLFNIGNINSAGFDLISLSTDNENTLFTTTLGPFNDSIAAGGSRNFSVTLNPTMLGRQIDTFRLRLRDSAADVGSGVGARDYALVFNVGGLIALPEPGIWAMMIGGFGLVGASARRRRHLVFA